MKFITFEDISGKLIHINLNQVGAFFVSPHSSNSNWRYLNFCFNTPEARTFTVTKHITDNISKSIWFYRER